MRDCYAVLGLAPGADLAAVKSAYRELLKTCHPDLKPDDPDAPRRFREITGAYLSIVEPHRADHGAAQLSVTGARRHSRTRTGLTLATLSSLATFAVLMWLDAGNVGAPRSDAAPPAASAGLTDKQPGKAARAITATDLARHRWPLWREVAGPQEAKGSAPQMVAQTESPSTDRRTADRPFTDQPVTGELVARAATAAALRVDGRSHPRTEPASFSPEPDETGAAPSSSMPATHGLIPVAGQNNAVLTPALQVAPKRNGNDAPPALRAVTESATDGAASREAPGDWRYYRNPTNGFTIRYPALLRRLAAPPALPGHRLFRSADGRVVARAYSGPALTRSTAELRQQLVARRYQGARLDVVTLARDRLILGGTIGGEAFREIALLSCDGKAVQGLALVYPTAEAKRHEPLFEAMSRSLTAARPAAFRCRARPATVVQ